MENQEQGELYKVIKYENPFYMEDRDDILIPSQEYIFDSKDKACKFLNNYYDEKENSSRWDRWFGEGNWYIERLSETFISFNLKSDDELFSGLINAVSLVNVYEVK